MSPPVVCITGASSGIGLALARVWATRGARLVLVARRLDRMEELQKGLPRPADVRLVQGDVMVDGTMENAVALAVRDFGGLDTVVANAGFGVVGAVEALQLEDFRRQFEINVFGVLRTVKAALPALKESKGRVALMGSVNAYVVFPNSSPYAMSKAALRALSESLWHELRPLGVSVTHLVPGFVESEGRRKNNNGVLEDAAVDPIPAWARMDALVAARKMVAAVEGRKKERVITAMGYWAVMLARHAPWLMDVVMRSSGMAARKEP